MSLSPHCAEDDVKGTEKVPECSPSVVDKVTVLGVNTSASLDCGANVERVVTLVPPVALGSYYYPACEEICMNAGSASELGELREAYYPRIPAGHGRNVANLHPIHVITCDSVEEDSSDGSDVEVVEVNHTYVVAYGTLKASMKTGTLITCSHYGV